MFNYKSKTFLILAVLFVTVIGLSVAVAADADNDATDVSDAVGVADSGSDAGIAVADNSAGTKDTQITKKSTDKQVKTEGEGNFTDLATDIEGSEVTLAKDYVMADGESAITITEDKTIDGAGHTINTTKGIFTINSGVTFTLKNTIIFSEYGPTYSTYYYDLYNKGNLIVDNVSFTYTRQWGNRTYGYPIYMDSDSTVLVNNSAFSGYDTNGALIYGYGARSNITVDNSLFTNYNTANTAIYLRTTGNVTVTNSNFTNAGATEGNGINYGGAFYLNNINQNAFIDNCIFDNITSSYRGAAMYVTGNTTVKNSLFKNLKQTKETYNGGAIWVNSANSQLYLENNVMENIQSLTADVYFNNGKLNSSLKVVGDNVAADEEAPVNIALNVTDDNGNSIDFRVSPFTMTIDDENIPISYGNGTITASFDASYDPADYPITINYDDSKLLGDVVIPEMNLTVKDIGLIKYKDVQEKIDAATIGSTIYIDGDVYRGQSESIVVNKFVTLDFNGNTIHAKSGKVFDIPERGVVTIKNATITEVDNPSVSVYNSEGRIANVSGIVTFEDVTFVNNKAPNMGSSAKGSFILALFEDSYVELKGCVIKNCTGTFINNVNSTVKIEDSYFRENNLGSTWDAVIANGGNLEINNTAFYKNTANIATIRGQSNTLAYSAYGGYYTCYNKPLTISNSMFVENYAGSGRGAAVNSQNDTTLTNCVFIDNRINQYSNKGGAVFSEAGDLNIDSCMFLYNMARYSVSYSGTVTANEGTAIYNAAGNMNIKNSIIVSNVTQASAVYNDAKDATVVANGNYWGTNNVTGRYASGSSADNITVDNWVVFNVTVDPADNIKYLDNITVKATLNTLNDGTPASVPDFGVVYFTAKNGELSSDYALVEDGVATRNFTVSYTPFTVTAKYFDNEVSYTGNAIMPEPQVITLNDANWTSYFNEDGTVNKTMVVPDSELRFEGTFNGREMIIDMPLNITTADTQAVLNNCTFTVKADGVRITKLEMNATDFTDCLINIDGASKVTVEDNKLTLANTGEKALTHAIEVMGGESNVIRNNNISTVGPEENIVYDANYTDIVTLYTTSIFAKGSNNLTVSGNRIFTEKNDKPAADVGTIYGVYVRGADKENKISDVKIVNNTIVTSCDVYAYGLTFNYAEDSLVEDNFINTVSTLYADGMQSYSISNSVINNNTVDCSAQNLTYGIIVNGEVDWDTYETYVSDENTISNNTITLESDYAWGIEFFVGEYNTAKNNNITITSDYGVGVGLADTSFTDMIENNIKVNATMTGSGESQDAVSPYTAGIKVQQSDMPMHAATDNNVINNTIVVTAPVDTVPAVNVTQRATITGNYLKAPLGLGDKAVVNTAYYGTTIKDNVPGTFNLTDSNYSNFFDDSCTLLAKYNESTLVAKGEFKENTYFIFDNIEVTFTTDGTAKFYNSTFAVTNDAKVVLEGLVIDNVDMEAIVIESEGNMIKDSVINVVSAYAIKPVQILADNNIIMNTNINATIASGDVVYNQTTWAVISTAPAGVYINSSNVLVENSVIYVDGTAIAEGSYYPSINGIDIESINSVIIENVTVKECDVTVIGPNYVYGINVGPTNHTTLDGVDIDVTSGSFAYGIQLFDAENLIASGAVKAEATTEAYGVYSTAMGRGVSKYLDFTGLNMDVNAPNAFGVKIEGSSNVVIADAEYNINGENAVAVTVYPATFYDAAYNPIYVYPQNITVTGMKISIDTTGDANVLYFGACDSVYVIDNNIMGNGGSEVFFNSTTNAKATDNYIKLSTELIGDNAFKTTETDTVIQDNRPTTSDLIDELLKQIEELNKTVQAQNDTINNLTQNVTDLQNNLTEANDKIANLTQNVTDLQNNLTEANDKIANLTQNVTALEQGLADANALIAELTANQTAANAKIDELIANQTAAKALVDELIANQTAANAKIDELTANMTAANDLIAQLTANQTRDEALINDLIANQTRDEALINELIANQTVANAKIDELIANQTVANAKIDELIANQTVAKALIDELIANQTVANAKIDELIANQTVANAKIDELIANQTAANDKINNLTSELASANSQIGSLQDNLTQADAKIDSLNKTAQAQAENIDALKDTTQAQANTIKDQQDTINAMNKTAQQQAEAIDANNNMIQDLQKQIDELAKQLNVTKKTTTIKYDTIKTATKGSTVKITGKLLADNKAVANQKVTVTVNNVDYSATTTSTGAFTVNYKVPDYNKQEVTYTYAGNEEYTESTESTTFDVAQPTTLKFFKVKIPKKDTTIKVSGKLLDANGKGIQGQTINIVINGKTYTAKTYSTGYFKINYKVDSYDKRTVKFTYNGNTQYLGSKNSTTFEVYKPTSISTYKMKTAKKGSTIKVSGKLLDVNGKGVGKRTVTIKINGKSYTAKTYNSGYFTIQYTPTTVGTNKVEFIFAGTALYKESSKSTTFQVKA